MCRIHHEMTLKPGTGLKSRLIYCAPKTESLLLSFKFLLPVVLEVCRQHPQGQKLHWLARSLLHKRGLVLFSFSLWSHRKTALCCASASQWRGKKKSFILQFGLDKVTLNPQTAEYLSYWWRHRLSLLPHILSSTHKTKGSFSLHSFMIFISTGEDVS